MAVTLTGTTGNDTLFGNTGTSSFVKGLEGNDRLISQYTQSTLVGAAGNDLLEIQAGDGSIVDFSPGKGNDTISISGISSLGYINVAQGEVGEFNLGNDVFNFNTANAAGTVAIYGTMQGGMGQDALTMDNGLRFVNANVNLNQDADNLSLTVNTALALTNTVIGLGAGADSATITTTDTGVSLNAFTLNGGKGADTLQLATDDLGASGNNIFALGGGLDQISATFAGSGFSSGTLTFRGDSGADTITFGLNAVTNVGGYNLSLFGDTVANSTAAHNDQITFDIGAAAIGLTGTIAGGGGADTITLTSTETTSSANQLIQGGFGADVIKQYGIAFAGTMDGGNGLDSLQADLQAAAVQSAQLGINFMTLVGGAGADTILNTGFADQIAATAGATLSSLGISALSVTIADFTTADVVKLLGQNGVNSDANVNASAFFTSSLTGWDDAGVTGIINNNIALFQDGDDAVFQIFGGTQVASAGIQGTLSLATAIGMGVIRFKNSALARQVADASGVLSNVSFSYTQSLNGASVNFT